jgi:four helix bundle protein
MKANNIILEKSYKFGLRIVKLYLFLQAKRKEYHLSVQVLRAGTSIGANTEEVIGASSRKDFKSKMDIAYKEARETHYWLRLLRDSGILDVRIANSLIADVEEILKILGSIIKSIKGDNS